MSRFTHLLTQPATCGWPAWHMEIQLLLTILQNIKVSCTASAALKKACSRLCMSQGTVLWCSRNSGPIAHRVTPTGAIIRRGKRSGRRCSRGQLGSSLPRLNTMAYCAENIAMDTCSSVQVRIPSGRRVVEELEEHLDNDANHWIETSTNEHAD